MKGISKRITGAIAALVVFIASFGLAGTAMAYDSTYAPSVTSNGTTITVQTPEANQEFYIQANDTYVAGFSVTPAADKWFGAYQSGPTGKATVTLNATDFGKKCGGDVKLIFSTTKSISGEFAEKTVTLPATGSAEGCPTETTSSNTNGTTTSTNGGKTAETGVAVLPFALVAALLVAAGAVMVTVRKSNR